LFHFARHAEGISLYGACFRNGPSSTHTQRKSARIIAAALNTVSTSREIPHEFRYHAKVLNDHLDEVLRSGMFDLSRTAAGAVMLPSPSKPGLLRMNEAIHIEGMTFLL